MDFIKHFLFYYLVMEPFLIELIVGDRVKILPGPSDRPTSSSKTLKESTDKDLPFITTENATTELIENGTFHENHLSTSATKYGPNKVAIFLPTAVIIIVIIVGAGMGLRVNRSSTKKTQTVSDEETQLQGDDNKMEEESPPATTTLITQAESSNNAATGPEQKLN